MRKGREGPGLLSPASVLSWFWQVSWTLWLLREEEEERHRGIGGAVRSDELRGALREHNLVVPAPGGKRGGGDGEERRREVTGPRTDAVN
jgi:hypothetical protein